MSNIQVKNVPVELHRRIRRLARAQDRTLRDIVLAALERELARVEMQERLSRRTSVDLGRPAAAALEDTRSDRDRELPR